eukprot:Rmarinus@m.11021
MDSVGNRISFSAVFDFSDMNMKTQRHLREVYSILAVMSVFASLGVYVYMLTHIAATISFLATVGCLLYAVSLPAHEKDKKRLSTFLFSFFKGMSLGSLVEIGLAIDATAVLAAAIGTILIFTCFSLSSLKSQSRSYLFLGGFLMSMTSLLFWMGLLNLFWGSSLIQNMQIYAGLALFCGYVLFDTQLMLAKSDAGIFDPFLDAINLFIDFVAIFVRILIILLKNREGDRNRRRR